MNESYDEKVIMNEAFIVEFILASTATYKPAARSKFNSKYISKQFEIYLKYFEEKIWINISKNFELF